MIYLDNAATSWPKPEEVYQAVDSCLRSGCANPGRGGHAAARRAGRILTDTREELAELFHVHDPNQIVFTSNATESINLALFGTVQAGWSIVTTAVEHNAVARPVRQLERSMGCKVHIVSCDQQGRINMEELKAVIQTGVDLVVIGHASNVTGVVMPLAEIGQLTKNAGALFIVDSAQTAGIEDIDVQAMNIDLLAFTGHKGLLGVQGTGGLYSRSGIALRPQRFGGTGSMSESDVQPDFLPDMLESGTPNTPGIAGLKAGVEYIKKIGLAAIRNKERQLITKLMVGLQEIKGISLYGPPLGEERSALLSFTLESMDSGTIAYALDRDYGIACRAGLHCAPWAHRSLHTLQTGAVRLSPGYFNTDQDIDTAIKAVAELACSQRRY